jgi:hypothetical protein
VLLGHSELALQAAPPFAPPRQRFPLQIGPIAPGGSGQSALLKHAWLLPLLQVPQRHLLPGDPLQFGLDVVSVRVTGSLALLRLIASVAMMEPAGDGQSRLVVPKSGRLGTVPLPSHARPARGPVSHVPPSTPSLIVVSPTQREQGWSTEAARKTLLESNAVFTASPLSTLAVPVIGPLNTFDTQVLTPPAASGRFDPKKN